MSSKVLMVLGYDSSKNNGQWRQDLTRVCDFHSLPLERPDRLHILEKTTQIKGIHTIIRNDKTSRDEFIFYAERLMCLLIEHALNFVPYVKKEVITSNGNK